MSLLFESLRDFSLQKRSGLLLQTQTTGSLHCGDDEPQVTFHTFTEEKKGSFFRPLSAQVERPYFTNDLMLSLFFVPSPLLSAVSVLPAYQLRVCQPPPEVPNADTLMEDGELEIGELSV